jgi:hypothetical protein
MALSQNAVNAALTQFNRQAQTYGAATDDHYIGRHGSVGVICHEKLFEKTHCDGASR